MNRIHARLSGLARPATGFVSQPEPRSIGSYARGRQLCAGNFLFEGDLIEAPETAIWDLQAPSPAYAAALHGFTWLDDLAAAGDGAARTRAQGWTLDWIARYGRGRGPGWTPDLTGRRLIRWVHHALMLLNGMGRADSQALYASLARQSRFLSRRWHSARPGLPRFEALTGLVYAGLSLTGLDRHTAPALRALERECARQIDDHGAIPSRNPEELLDIFTLLTWAEATLRDSGRAPGPAHRAAIDRIAPVLRALRHADGGLARFHGGGRGLPGRLDQALAEAGVRPRAIKGLAMGYARLSAGRTSVIVDAARPPARAASHGAHAATLALELTSGRRPLIVNCGAGGSFGPDWRKAGRATLSHSALALAGVSSSRLGRARGRSDGLWLLDTPRIVEARRDSGLGGHGLTAWHDGYGPTHGLTHVRQLQLAYDGRSLSGEDTLAAFSDAERAQFDRAMDRASLQGIGFSIRFHLHPDVHAALDMGGSAVSLALKSGEIWVFRHDGVADLQVAASVYLEKGRLRPRATQQIVLSARAMDYATLITWTLAKAQDTPPALRDLEPDDPDQPHEPPQTPWSRDR